MDNKTRKYRRYNVSCDNERLLLLLYYYYFRYYDYYQEPIT